MPKRTLAIGLGGTGKACLTILKERLEEAFGQVPDEVALLCFDTDDWRDIDEFAGAKLSSSEFVHITSRPGVTMDTIFADIASGRTASHMQWLENEKLSRVISPSERDIRGGAQQRRPIGRVALFQRWDNPIYASILSTIGRMYGEPEKEDQVNAVEFEQNKRQIFIIGSVAGGTGSGFMIDVANLVRHAVDSNSQWQAIDVSAIIVLPDAFSPYTTTMNDPTNLKPNSYATLRELDRFIRTHSAMLPYMIRYGDALRSITWSTSQPVDHVYLVDTTSPNATGDVDLGGSPMLGIFPIISDFVMAHIDQSLGDALATLRANAGQHYNKEEGWQYSSFNVMTYILPIEDIVESFSYRFLREMLSRQYLPIADNEKRALIAQKARKETETVFSEGSVKDNANPSVIQKSIAATRCRDPELPDMSWPGLFNMIAISGGKFAQDYEDLDGWLAYLSSRLIPTGEGVYKHETFDEGYRRLLNLGEEFMEECLGPKTDPDDEEKRFGGEWDKILGPYRDALRLRFSEALDAALLDVLNRRDLQSKVLMPAQMPWAQVMVTTLREKLVEFKQLLENEYREMKIETRLRQTNEELRNSMVWMQDTKDTKTRRIFGKPEARKAQEGYIGWFYEKMELLLHQRVYRTVLDVLNALGAAEVDQSGNLSVIYQAALELENWQVTFQEADKLLDRWWRVHERERDEKRQVKVRRYLTDEEFEDQLYRQPQHVEKVSQQVLGQERGTKGITWRRVDDMEPLNYKMISVWAEEAEGPEEIARKFFRGAKDLFQVVRKNVTIADRVAQEFSSPERFAYITAQFDAPFLSYNPAVNGKSMFNEHFVSFQLSSAEIEAQDFFEKSLDILQNQGRSVDSEAESSVACTIVEIARGAKLRSITQFISCEPDYRSKLYEGRESIHLFSEEQVATDYEQLIETLGEPDNRIRPLSPELVVAMGDEAKLKIFTLACAYKLIQEAPFRDPETGLETTELILDLSSVDGPSFPLSQSRLVRKLDSRFDRISPEAQSGYLYLNALQNFVIKATQKPNMPNSMRSKIVDQLSGQGVSFENIGRPFGLSIRVVNEAISQQIQHLTRSERSLPDQSQKSTMDARQRVMDYLRPFLLEQVAEFKQSPVQKIRDMGTVMHLILNREIDRLLESARRGAFTVLFEYDSVTSIFDRRGHQQNANKK
jgi:hypothetical protein